VVHAGHFRSSEGAEGRDYALYKFRRPVDHVSVYLDILVNARDIPRAVKSLRERGFRVLVPEPYTVTMERAVS